MTAGTVADVAPNAPKTPIHNFRIPEEIWAPAAARAKERGETVTDVVLRALKEYAR